jgi:hypothetical protein
MRNEAVMEGAVTQRNIKEQSEREAWAKEI